MPVNEERLYQYTNVGVTGVLVQNDRLHQLTNVGVDGVLEQDDRLYQYTNMAAGTPCPWVNGTDKAIATPNQPLTIYGRGFEPATTDTGPEARAYHTNDPFGTYTVMGALTAWTDEEVTVSVPPGIPNPSYIRVVHTGIDASPFCDGSNLVFQQVAPFDPIPAEPEAGWWVEAWSLDNNSPLVRGLPVVQGPWQQVLNDIGDGSITLPAPDPENPDAWNRHRELCDPPNNVTTLLKVYIDGLYAYSFWADQISDPYGEPANKVVDITGRGIEAITDWGRLYPRDYDAASPLASTRFPDWNYGFDLSYFENFEGSNTIGPDYAARNDGYILETLTPGVFEVVPIGLKSGVQRTYEVEPGTEVLWSIEVQAITTPGQRVTAGIGFGDDAITIVSPNTFEEDGEYLSEIGNVPYAGGCPGGATSASWQTIVVQLFIPDDVTSVTTFVQSDHAASCGAPGNIPFYVRNATFLGKGWNTPQGWYSTNLTVFEVRDGLGKDLTKGLYVQGNTTGAFSFTNVEVAVNPGEPVALIAECATTAVWYVEAADVETGLPLSATVPIVGTGVYELRRVDWTPPAGVTSVLLRVVFDINQGTFEAQIDNVGVATGQDPATPGRIIREMLEAIQLRGTIAQLEIDFTDTNDSDGNLWTRSISMNFGHGQTLYEVLAQLVAQGFEWQVAPKFASIGGDLSIVLSLFNGRATGAIYGVGENQEVTQPATAATIREGQIMAEGESTQVIPRNTTFGEGAVDQTGGGTLVTQSIDGPAVAGYGRREDFFTNQQALDAQTLQDAAATRLENLRKQSVAATIELLQASPYIPGSGFRLGDTIKVDLGVQIPEGWYRIARIGATLAGEGDVDIRYVVDVGTVIVPEDAVEAVTLARLVALTQLSGSTPGSGQSTGTTTGVSGAPLILPGTEVGPHTHPYSEIVPGGLTGDLAGTNPSPIVAKIRGKSVTTSTPTERDVLAWDDTANLWELGRRMNWLNRWVEGATYHAGDTVIDGVWTMVANTTTDTRPAPQPEGFQSWLHDDAPAWALASVNDSVISGLRVAGLTNLYYGEAIRVWIQDTSATTVYQVFIIDNTTEAVSIESPFVGSDVPGIGWFPIGRPVVMGPGDDFSILLLQHSSNTGAATTEPWTFIGDSNQDNDPGSGNCELSKNDRTFRISETDDNAASQAALLAGTGPGDVIRMTDQGDANAWLDLSVVQGADEGAWWNFDVAALAAGPNGSPAASTLCDVSFTPAAPDPQTIVSLPNFWLGNAVLSGEYAEGNNPLTVDDNAYGIDVFFQEYVPSPDWDLLSLSSNSAAFGSGGGGTGGGHIIEDEGIALPQQPTLNFAGAGVTATDDPGNNATLVTIPGGGGGAVNPAMTASIALASNQTMTADTEVKVAFDTLQWDNASMADTVQNRLTAPDTGQYILSGIAKISLNFAANDYYHWRWRKNGVDQGYLAARQPKATSDFFTYAVLVDLTAGDYVEIWADLPTGTPILVEAPSSMQLTSVTAAPAAGPKMAKAIQTVGTPIPQAIVPFTQVLFQGALYDTDGMFNPANPNRLTVTTAGRYDVVGTLGLVTSSAGPNDTIIYLRRYDPTGTTVLDEAALRWQSSWEHAGTVSAMFDCVPGDQLILEAYQTVAGAPLTAINLTTLSATMQSNKETVLSERGELITAGAGPAAVVTGTHRVYASAGRTILNTRVSCGTAPSGGPLTIDIKLNGTTSIFPTTPLPACADGTNDSGLVIPDTTGWASGTYLTFDVVNANGAEDVTIQTEWEIA